MKTGVGTDMSVDERVLATESLAQETRLVGSVQMAGYIALTASGVAVFLPTATLLATSGESTMIQWLLYVLLLGAWLSGFAIRGLEQRAVGQLSASVLLLALPLALSDWPPLSPTVFAYTCFGLVVGGALCFRSSIAVLIVLVVAILDFTVTGTFVPTAELALIPVGGLMGPLTDLICGVGLVVARADWIRLIERMDREHLEARTLYEENRRDLEVALAKSSVERRIHETVLNTLAAISMGQANDIGAQRAAQRDLEMLDEGPDRLAPAALRSVVAAAVAALSDERVHCRLELATDPILEGVAASALRDAIVEALRNVHRHAGVGEATIQAEASDALTVTVIDRGLGMSPEVTERFGLRSAIRSGIEAVGGQVVIHSSPGAGTTVSMSVPLAFRTPSPPEIAPVSRLVDASSLGRLGFSGANVVLLLTAWSLTSWLEPQWYFLPLVVAFSLVNLALAYWWNTAYRIRLAIAAIVISSGFFMMPLATSPSCDAAPSVSWLIALAVGGGSVLAVIAFRELPAQIIGVGVIGSLALVCALALPAGCRQSSLIGLLVSCGYLVAIVVMLTWADVRFDGSREAVARRWQEIVAQQVSMQKAMAERETWGNVAPSTRMLLMEIASGEVEASDERIRARASIEAYTVRSGLGLLGGDDIALQQLVHHVTAAVGPDTVFDADVLVPLTREDALPSQAIAQIVEVLRDVNASAIQIRAIADDHDDELVLSIRCTDLAGVVDSVQEVRDCIIEVSPDNEEGLLTISLRRPSALSGAAAD